MTRFRKVLRSIDIDDASIMPAGGRSLTIPGQSVNISDAITRYSAPSIVETLQGYYEEEGMELPNFDRLDKIERLQLLADTKDKAFMLKKKAEAMAKADKEAFDKAAADKAASNPIPSPSNTPNHGDGK